jgi:hypothetical protein
MLIDFKAHDKLVKRRLSLFELEASDFPVFFSGYVSMAVLKTRFLSASSRRFHQAAKGHPALPHLLQGVRTSAQVRRILARSEVCCLPNDNPARRCVRPRNQAVHLPIGAGRKLPGG